MKPTKVQFTEQKHLPVTDNIVVQCQNLIWGKVKEQARWVNIDGKKKKVNNVFYHKMNKIKHAIVGTHPTPKHYIDRMYRPDTSIEGLIKICQDSVRCGYTKIADCTDCQYRFKCFTI